MGIFHENCNFSNNSKNNGTLWDCGEFMNKRICIHLYRYNDKITTLGRSYSILPTLLVCMYIFPLRHSRVKSKTRVRNRLQSRFSWLRKSRKLRRKSCRRCKLHLGSGEIRQIPARDIQWCPEHNNEFSDIVPHGIQTVGDSSSIWERSAAREFVQESCR